MNITLKTIAVLVLAMFFCLTWILQVWAYAINDLIEEAKNWDQTDVEIQGEVIGDVFRQKEFSWVNINDGSNVIGVWTPYHFLKGITPGDYRKTGTFVRVKGRFHRACRIHQGETDIHAVSMEIVQEAKPRRHKVQRVRVWWLILLGIVAIVISLDRRGRVFPHRGV